MSKRSDFGTILAYFWESFCGGLEKRSNRHLKRCLNQKPQKVLVFTAFETQNEISKIETVYAFGFFWGSASLPGAENGYKRLRMLKITKNCKNGIKKYAFGAIVASPLDFLLTCFADCKATDRE